MTFGGWLKTKRIASGLTQERLAELANNICTSAYISSLEREADIGKSGNPTRPSIEVVDALANALHESVADARLAAGYAPPKADELLQYEDALANALLFKFDKLSEEDKKKLRPILEMLEREITRQLSNDS